MLSDDDISTYDLIFSCVGIVTGTFFYLTPLFAIYNLNKGKINVDQTSGMGMFFSLISSLLWIMPFILDNLVQKDSPYLLFFICNCLGCLLNFCWTILYLYYFTKHNNFRYFIYILAVVDVIAEISFIETDQMPNKSKSIKREIIQITIYKWLASTFNIVMYFSPGLNIVEVFKQKNRELISISGSFIGLFNCGAWLAFGLRDIDLPIVVANGSGLGLCLIQIILFFHSELLKKKTKLNLNRIIMTHF